MWYKASTLVYRLYRKCTILYCTVQYCTLLYNTVLYYTILYCTVQYSTVQTVQVYRLPVLFGFSITTERCLVR